MNYEDWEIENKVFEKPYEFGVIEYLIVFGFYCILAYFLG